MATISTRIAAAATLSALALSLSACGGGDDDKAAKSISASIMKSQKKSGASQFLDLDKKDADCIGKGMVDKVGVDNLKKYKVLTKDGTASSNGVNDTKMSGDDAKATTDVLFKCTDVEAMMQKAITKSGSLPSSMQGCVKKVLVEDNLRPLFEKVFEGKQSEAQQALTKPLTKCASGS